MAKTLEEKIETMQAALAGKMIQKKPKYCACCNPPMPSLVQYADDTEPTWDWNVFDYRVRPEPRRWTVHVDEKGRLSSCYGMKDCSSSDPRIIVQEVLE